MFADTALPSPSVADIGYLTMPVMDGRETLQKIFAIRGDVPAILMSGYTPTDLDTPLPHEFLQKPFTPSALRAAVRRVLRGR